MRDAVLPVHGAAVVLDDADICSLMFIAGVLILLARPFIRDARIYERGFLVAGVVSLADAVGSLVEQDFDTHYLARWLLRSATLGALLIGPAWVLLSILQNVTEAIGAWRIQRSIRREAHRLRLRHEEQDALQRAHERRLREEQERQRPERERREREAAEVARQAAEQRRKEQARREAARFQSRLVYDRYAAELKPSIPRKRFDDYLESYLADQFPADVVEERAKSLQAMMLDYFEPRRSRNSTLTMTTIRELYARQRAELEVSNLDEESKAALLVDLNRQEDKALRELRQT